MKSFVLILALAMYILVVVFAERKSLIALAAAAILVFAGVVGPVEALRDHVDWNILAIYVGSMVVAELMAKSRAPAWVAERVVERARSPILAVMAILLMTGMISAWVENVATVILMAPIALEVARKTRADPVAILVGLALMANLQGTATLLGDPPSMIFASHAGYGFNDFFLYSGRLSIFFSVQAGAVAGIVFLMTVFRGLGRKGGGRALRQVVVELSLPPEKVLSPVPALLLAALVAGLAAISLTLGKGLHPVSGLFCAVVAFVGLAWYALDPAIGGSGDRAGIGGRILGLLKGMAWSGVAFIAGVFIVAGAMAKVGIFGDLAALLGSVVGGNAMLGFVAIVSISVLVSGFVDNVPFMVAMLPVAGNLAGTMGVAPELLMFGLLIGSCLGGNLTPFGASANVAAMAIARGEVRTAGFRDWARTAVPFTVLSTAAAALFTYLVWR